jgi:putative transposase
MNGNRLKLLTLCDEFSREALAVEVARTFTGKDVKAVLERVFLERGRLPKYIRSDDGSEFIASPIREWLSERGVKTIYIEPGRPWQNGKGESFNGKLRDECLAQEWFYNLREAKVVIEQWRRFYNRERPHSSLDYLTPEEYRLKYAMKESEIKSENLAFSLG